MQSMPAVRLRVTMTIDIDATDYLEAAEHQKRLETCLGVVRDSYPSLAVEVRERRGAKSRAQAATRPFRVQSGKLNAYEP